ncbi:hypothetical protein Barb7_01625 [Bacteroidales bacterium Barb7]|nr:hypothetical protein Barb7_01625 [Bacteroidales bacterium Barb7]
MLASKAVYKPPPKPLLAVPPKPFTAVFSAIRTSFRISRKPSLLIPPPLPVNESPTPLTAVLPTIEALTIIRLSKPAIPPPKALIPPVAAVLPPTRVLPVNVSFPLR